MTLKCLFAWRAVVVVVVAMADAFAFAWFTSTNGCHDGSLATLRTPMKAVIRCDCGTVQVLKLVDVKRPVPAADEVLVKVPAGAIDPRDRAGGVNRGPGRATASAQPTDGVCARRQRASRSQPAQPACPPCHHLVRRSSPPLRKRDARPRVSASSAASEPARRSALLTCAPRRGRARDIRREPPMRLIHPPGALAIMLAFACCTPLHAQPSTQDDAIVFRREVLDPRTGASSQALFLTDRWGITLTQVTAPPAGVRDDEASWSPDGTHLVFARYTSGLESELLIVDRDGQRISRLTSGKRDNHEPVWGPGSLIAFESAQSDPLPDCLRVIDWPTRRQRELFCPVADYNGAPTDVQSPTWSADGASIHVATSHAVGRLGEAWWGDVYRVDVATGAAIRLARASLDEQSHGIIAADGRNAVFKRTFGEGGLTLLNLTDGTQTSLGGGDAPVFSGDGRQLAFVRTVTVGTWPDLMQLAQVLVADLETGTLRQVTDHRDPTLRFATIDWSDDGTLVLLQHWNEGDARRQLAILDLATAELWPLPQGTPSDDAWFDR